MAKPVLGQLMTICCKCGRRTPPKVYLKNAVRVEAGVGPTQGYYFLSAVKGRQLTKNAPKNTVFCKAGLGPLQSANLQRCFT